MRFFKKSDLIIIFTVLVIGVALLFANKYLVKDRTAKAEIYYGSELVKTVDLKKGTDTRFSIPQNERVIFHLFKDGSICFEESDCPDKICVKTGRLSKVHETAACLPNKIIMKIVPADDQNNDEIDMIVGK